MWQDFWTDLWRLSARKVDNIAGLIQIELKNVAIGTAIKRKL